MYCNSEVGDLDWNQNGVVEGPLLGWADVIPFYVQYLDYAAGLPTYSTKYPNSTCGVETSCNYHSDCAADEYCAGDDCSAEMLCDPFFDEGVCTPKRDVAECASEPIVPMCGCDSGFYLSMCHLEAAGVRYQSNGLCAPVDCPGGTDAECPCNFHCVTSQFFSQCLPD